MASDARFAQYVADQTRSAGLIETRKMFGEYALYCDGKVVALICDDTLYIKPTDAGRVFIGAPAEGPPFPGAKMHFVVTDQLDDAQWLCELIRITFRELPLPKPKSPSKTAPATKKSSRKKETLICSVQGTV